MDERPPRDMVARGWRVVALAGLVAFAGLAAFIIASRLRYPYDIEWMGGAILDHVERVRAHQPIYGPPSVAFTPYIYPPGYYWAAAAASHLFSLRVACRVVSIVSSVVTAACAYPLARSAGASRYHAALGALLYVAAFGYDLQWYDVERADALLCAMLAVSAVVLLRSRGLAAAAVAGLVAGLAFYVKQPATTFLAIVPLALVVARQLRRALAFGAGAVVGVVPLYVWLQATTHGWFAYYCLKLPVAHGMAAKYFTLFFVSDVSRGFAFTFATAAVVAVLARATRDRLRGGETPSMPLVVLGGYVLAGFAASATSRMHVGGWPNVLMFWTTFACPAFAVAATRVEDVARGTPAARAVSFLLPALALLQAGAVAPDPNESIPGPENAKYAAQVVSRVHELERGGAEVILFGRGNVTARRHLHINAFVDVLRGGGEIPADMRAGFESRAYGAFILDKLDDLSLTGLLPHRCALFSVVLRNYFVAERLDDREPMPVVGYPTVPRWVLRPRRAPLEGADEATLERRMWIEAGLAERNMRLARAHPGADRDGLDIETEAARLDAQAQAGAAAHP